MEREITGHVFINIRAGQKRPQFRLFSGTIPGAPILLCPRMPVPELPLSRTNDIETWPVIGVRRPRRAGGATGALSSV